MRGQRWVAVGLTFAGLLGVSAVLGQKAPEGGQSPGLKSLEPGATAVRLLLGAGDPEPRSWDGKLKLDRGEILAVEGYRFRQGDLVTGRDTWKARSHVIRKAAAKKQAAARKEQGGPSSFGEAVAPNGVVVTLKAADDATLTVETERGAFDVKLSDLAKGEPIRALDGKAVAQRVAQSIPLFEGPDQQDFPAAAADPLGGVWVAYVEHKPRGPETSSAFTERPKDFAAYKPTGGGDQVKLVHVVNGKPEASLAVTEPGRDVWRPAVALTGTGDPVVVWSENSGDNFDLYARLYDPDTKVWTEPRRLTTAAGADVDASLARAGGGQVWMAWQSWDKGKASIWLRKVFGTGEEAKKVSEGEGNAWSPSLAIDRKGEMYVGYDTYDAGNYDVVVRACGRDGTPEGKFAVAATPRYETRPSLAADPRGRIWVAYEERTENWGKDAENLIQGQGSTLYRSARVRVKAIDPAAKQVLEATDPLADASGDLKALNSFPRLAIDDLGRVWLAFRHRQEAVWGNQAVMVVGGVWLEYVTALAGAAWDEPRLLPRSDGLLDNRPALVVAKSGLLTPLDGADPLLVAYSSDGRLRREVEFSPELAAKYYSHSGTPPGVYDNDLFLAHVTAPTGPVEPKLTAVDAPKESAEAVHPAEAEDVARMRNYRVQAGGKTYRLFRGDFHRHTEISQDGGSDGSLEDMWRYAIDAAAFDWMGNADHDNGGGKEYTWWLVQKTTDLYNNPALVTLFTYERSVSYPHGHRNVMFDHRGVRTLPRLISGNQVVDEDTAMLYDYLKEHGGICASHTSGTGMGTDWRDLNPTFEPMVEIFQGHRNSYEHLGAPRVARRPGEAIGGWKPLGMVWNALAMQYRLGFQASSDHISTHISYAVAVAEEPTRVSVLDAFRKRHCYGATDNIVLDVRSGEYIMGDEFAAPADGRVKLKIHAQGTRPIAKVDVIKDFMYVYSTEPNKSSVDFEWSDEETRRPGLSWYYVRVIQDDGELAWASPLWVRSGPGAGNP